MLVPTVGDACADTAALATEHLPTVESTRLEADRFTIVTLESWCEGRWDAELEALTADADFRVAAETNRDPEWVLSRVFSPTDVDSCPGVPGFCRDSFTAVVDIESVNTSGPPSAESTCAMGRLLSEFAPSRYLLSNTAQVRQTFLSASAVDALST